MLCMGFPEVTEEPFGGHTSPAFRVRGKLFAIVSESLEWVTFKGAPGIQQALVAAHPERFFVPAYVGHKGWVSVYVRVDLDWAELEELLMESYQLIAPRSLAAKVSKLS